jgi:hypothetical protein
MGQERIGSDTGSVFRTEPLELVTQGMVVIDRDRARVGTVEYVQMGDPEAVTTRGQDYQATGLIGDAVRSVFGAEPDVPEPLRSQLLRHGFIKVDGPGLIDSDRYVRGDQVASVGGDTVTLSVTRDQLIEEH